MGSVNRVTLVGNLGADPEMRYTQDGKPVASLRIATTESWKDAQGNKQEKTEWHRIVVWGATAEACKQYLAKGRQVYVEGKIQTRKWTDKEGVEKYTTEIVASSVIFLGSGQGQNQTAQGGSRGGGRGAAPAAGGGRGAPAAQPEPDGYGEPPAGDAGDVPF